MNNRTYRLRLLGLLAMAGALVACNRETFGEINPDYDPETNEVNTQFVVSVATGQSAKTRMTAESVQLLPNFFGITDAKLYAYQTGLAAPYVNYSDGTGFKKSYNLGLLYSNGDITASDNLESSSHRILQLSIPVGTDAMLFYGKAINDNPGKQRGMTTAVYSDTPSETYFNINRRIGDEDNVKKYDATARLMIFAINRIMHSELASGDSYGYTGLDPISWIGIGHQYEINNDLRTGTKAELSPLAESLGKTWSTFTTIKAAPSGGSPEYRAGYSSAVKKMMQDMYEVVSKAATATPTSAEEANAKRLAVEIERRMNEYFTNSWEYKEIDAIKNGIVPSVISEAEWNNATTGFVGAQDLNNYPYGVFGIPEGAAQLDYDTATDMFSYKHPNQALVTQGNEFEPRKYVYPAELFYYVNSPLRVTDKSNIAVSDFPNGVNPWNDDTSSGNKWTAGNWLVNKPVASSTRGVAIRDNINYGVALLETNVAWSTDAVTAGTLQDNKANMTDDPDNKYIDLADTHFALRGILVGGAHPRVNWQFLPTSVSGVTGTGGAAYGNFDGVVYDDVIANTAVPTQAPNYTTVFDNFDWRQAAQNDVRVALEFQNNGDDFWGRDNLIPNGGVFYLVGVLPVAPKNLTGDTSADQVISWPEYYQIPPIWGVDGEAVPSGKTAGMSKQIPRVFIQDFVTKVTFRIGVTSLQKAYVTVPDLRSSQMSLGLSVDIQWQNGYEYDIEF